MPTSNEWAGFYDLTKNSPPSALLLQALAHVKNKGKAIDIGGGALKDTRHLLAQGFDVTAIDNSELMAKEAQAISSHRFHYFVSTFAKFDFPKNNDFV